jgi:hypothetical protein
MSSEKRLPEKPMTIDMTSSPGTLMPWALIHRSSPRARTTMEMTTRTAMFVSAKSVMRFMIFESMGPVQGDC